MKNSPHPHEVRKIQVKYAISQVKYAKIHEKQASATCSVGFAPSEQYLCRSISSSCTGTPEEFYLIIAHLRRACDMPLFFYCTAIVTPGA